LTTDPALYRLLVPDAPLHRRTERDRRPAPEIAPRARAGALLRGTAARPGLQRPSLVSSFRDRIDTILFAFPNYGVSQPALAEAYQSVVRALRVGTRFVVVHHKSGGRHVKKWFDSAGHPAANVTFVPLPDYVSFTDWAEDAYVALTEDSGARTYLMEPWEFPRAGDALLAEAIQEVTDIQAAQAPLIFQGGNCLVGDEFWLMGKDYFADSLSLVASDRAPVEKPDRKSPAAFLRRLFKDYVDADRKLVVLGTAKEIAVREYYGTREGRQFFLDLASGGTGLFQPIFHIDMFVTLVGWNARREFQVLVGSPAMADEMLGTTSPFALDDVYDTLAKALAREGFEVTRNPLVHRPTIAQTTTVARLRDLATTATNEALLDAVKELEALGARDSTKVNVRDWHHVTWNNCLVENTETVGRHVYLPTFGHRPNGDLKTIDVHMKKLWTSLGFTVHPLADFNEFARRQGVVHCIKKYLRRGP
jgi:hypothetical protein